MSTALPVPSKVAVTAIRGLIVGTTCSLALITEDRRRRINNAHNAIQNAERIRSARNYHAGGAALALAIEEDAALYSATHVHRSPSVDRWDFDRDQFKSKAKNLEFLAPSTSRQASPCHTDVPTRSHDRVAIPDSKDKSEHTPLASKYPARARLKPPMLSLGPFADRGTTVCDAADRELKTTTTSLQNKFAFPRDEDLQRMIREAASSKDGQMLDQVLHLVLQAFATQAKGSYHLTTIDTCALLCVTCRNMGNLDGAEKILSMVIKSGPLPERDYHRFQPLRLVYDRIRLDFFRNPIRDRAFVERFSHTVDLYLPKFTSAPEFRHFLGLKVGSQLLGLAFEANCLGRVNEIYLRCRSFRRDDCKFTTWYISKLHERGADAQAIKVFLRVFRNISPTPESVRKIGITMVEAVEVAQGYKAAEVLRSLDQLASGKCNAKWVARLLEAHYRRTKDWDETAALFAPFQERGLGEEAGYVGSPEVIWRVMVQLAHKAGRDELALSYTAEATIQAPEFKLSIDMVMVEAQHKAEDGDWDAVDLDLMKVKIANDYDAERVSRRFVPILTKFAETHTIPETDTYLRRYINELKIPVCRGMVTFMTMQYGTVRDIQSLVAWLEYCAEGGYQADPALSNAVLSSCRHKWKFPHRDLRNLYLKLKALNPGSTDEYTERIMVDAALAQAASGRSWKKHTSSLLRSRVKTPRSVALAGECVAQQDLVLRMKEEYSRNHAGNVITMYKRSVNHGVQTPAEAVRLAIMAAVNLRFKPLETAYDILEKADRRGVDTGSCAAPIIMARLRQIDRGSIRLGREARIKEIRGIVDEISKRGFKVSDTALNQAASFCLKREDARETARFALMAAEASAPGTEPCYNLHNYSVFVVAHAMLGDVKMVRFAIARAKSKTWWTDPLCLRALKQARWLVSRHDETQSVWQLLDIVKNAIKDCVEARGSLQDQQLELESEVIGIVRSAAEDQAEEQQQDEADRADTFQPKLPVPVAGTGRRRGFRTPGDRRRKMASRPQVLDPLPATAEEEGRESLESPEASDYTAKMVKPLQPPREKEVLDIFEETMLSKRHDATTWKRRTWIPCE